MENKPIIGITMENPAGTDLEISTKAFTDPVQYGFCRLTIIGDADIMEQAEGLVGHPEIRIHRCGTVADAFFQLGTINVLHLPLIADINASKLAKVNAGGGSVIFQCMKKVIELVMAGEVDVTCTSALNKEVMNLALAQGKGAHSDGYTHSDGHTEIYAAHTGIKKYTMMLARHDLRMVYVSTHTSLREACERMKETCVLEVTEIANQACEDMGIENPRITVTGLSPYCGENNLFGREETEEITPAIEATKAEGITGVMRPCPPDSVFPQTFGGWYDTVICMYHDQGHIPLKTVGFAYDRGKKDWRAVEGADVTLGLPIVHASVGHDIDFYHAGKGNGSEKSLISVMKYTTRMAVGRKKGAAC